MTITRYVTLILSLIPNIDKDHYRTLKIWRLLAWGNFRCLTYPVFYMRKRLEANELLRRYSTWKGWKCWLMSPVGSLYDPSHMTFPTSLLPEVSCPYGQRVRVFDSKPALSSFAFYLSKLDLSCPLVSQSFLQGLNCFFEVISRSVMVINSSAKVINGSVKISAVPLQSQQFR